MDISNNVFRPAPSGHSSTSVNSSPESPPLTHPEPKRKRSSSQKKVLQLGYTVLFVGLLVLVVGIVLLLSINNPQQEGGLVNTRDYQAVFVNVTGSTGGQAYFGHITRINTQYIVLNDVFYLETGSSSNQFTLNKRSCAIDDPVDPMIINRSQVDYWENLNSSSQIAQDITKWNDENLSCPKSTSSSSSTTSSPTSTTSGTTGSTTTTPSSTSTTTK